MTDNKKSLARSFIQKVAQKQQTTPEETAQVGQLSAEAGFEKGQAQATNQILNPQNVKVKTNNFKQGVVQTLSHGFMGGF